MHVKILIKRVDLGSHSQVLCALAVPGGGPMDHPGLKEQLGIGRARRKRFIYCLERFF